MAHTSDAEEAVREFTTRFLDGSFADATDLLTGDGREAVVGSFPEEFREESMDAEDALEGYWWGLYGQYGASEGVSRVRVEGDEATVAFDFEDGDETATVDVRDGAVAGFSFSPAYEAPDYADGSAFVEREVTVDAGDVDLDGVLAIPDGDGPFPGVVLVHGAGTHDPDGTAGTSKILKDLAWGLASEGIAALRYEKRLAEHEVDDENYTLDAVVVDDAVAAVNELAAADEVSEDAVFVAGHSQGGMCAPRIAERHGGVHETGGLVSPREAGSTSRDVAGVVVLDGLADPVLDPDDVDFIRYEFEIDGDLDEEQEAQLEADREEFRRIADGDFEDDETIFGRPGRWHRSVGNYDPVGTASGLDAPVFVLKTARADEERQPELAEWLRKGFEDWQAGDLPDGSRVELYEGLDHYFQPGFAPTTPLGLYFGGNVAGDVVTDLAEWIHDAASR